MKCLNSFQGTEFFRAINEYLMYVSGILYYVSSTINPILYNLMSLKYRQVPNIMKCAIAILRCKLCQQIVDDTCS